MTDNHPLEVDPTEPRPRANLPRGPRLVTHRSVATALALLLGGQALSLGVTFGMLSGAGGAMSFVGPFLLGGLGLLVSFLVSLRVVTVGASSGPIRIEPPIVAVCVVLLGWLVGCMLAIPRNGPLALVSFEVPQLLGLGVYAWMRSVR